MKSKRSISWYLKKRVPVRQQQMEQERKGRTQWLGSGMKILSNTTTKVLINTPHIKIEGLLLMISFRQQPLDVSFYYYCT